VRTFASEACALKTLVRQSRLAISSTGSLGIHTATIYQPLATQLRERFIKQNNLYRCS